MRNPSGGGAPPRGRLVAAALVLLVALVLGGGTAGARTSITSSGMCYSTPYEAPPPAFLSLMMVSPGYGCTTDPATWDVSPLYDGAYYADDSAATAAEPAPPAAVTPALPTWRNLYDWPNGHGYVGWHAASSGAPYGMQGGLAGLYGLWLWPTGGQQAYTQNDWAEWTYTAPGTTRISSVQLSLSYRNKLLAHHCIDIGFRDASGAIVTHNEHCTPVQPPDSQHQTDISLVDPAANPTSTVLYFRIRVDCGGASTCAKTIPQLDPTTNGPMARLLKVDMTLVDDDLPDPYASGSFYDLADDYTNGSSTYDLTVGGGDAGSGITQVWLDQIGGPRIATSNAPCDPTHHTDALDNRICPADYSTSLTVDTSVLPEGRSQYTVGASDVASNTATWVPWSVSVDRTAPLTGSPATSEWYDPQTGEWAVNWDPGTDPPLADGTDPSGVAQSRYRYSINGGAFTDWQTDDGAEIVLSDTSIGDTVTIDVQGIDAVANANASVTTTLSLDSSTPVAPVDDPQAPPYCKDSADPTTCTPIGTQSDNADVLGFFAVKRPGVTRSYYEHDTNTAHFRSQGCLAAKSSARGVVLLDFGRPIYEGHQYGTLLLSVNKFASMTAIRKAAIAFGSGFVRCGGARRGSMIVAISTNNSCSLNDRACGASASTQPPSFAEEGRRLAAAANAFGTWIGATLRRSRALTAAAGDDIEPAWEDKAAPVHTTDLVAGYNGVASAPFFYDFGSNESAANWTPAIRYRLAYGLPRDFPIPQIYYTGMADEWHDTSQWGAKNGRFGKIFFAGVLSQYHDGDSCGYTPAEGYDHLLSALNADPLTTQRRIPFLSNIVCHT
jgi:hypothetical protein